MINKDLKVAVLGAGAMGCLFGGLLAEKGLTRQDAIEFEQKGRNENQDEGKIKGVNLEAIVKTFSKLNNAGNESILNALGLDTPNESIPDLNEKSKAWLVTQGVVDANGEGYLQKTDIEAAVEATRENTLEDIRIQEKELQRELTTTEKASLAYNNWYEVVTEDVSDNSILNLLGESTPVAQNRKLREGYEKAQLSSNLGDFASYLVTGNMPGRYSPENVMYEETHELYDLKIIERSIHDLKHNLTLFIGVEAIK